jgi:predicted DNA-binding transcriptional regulator YafY
LKVMRAVPEPFRPAAAATSQRILVDPAGWMRTEPVADAEAVDDEWVQLRLRFPAVAAARTLLSFGGHVEVVSPPEVRADLVSVAADVVARYGSVTAGRVV